MSADPTNFDTVPTENADHHPNSTDLPDSTAYDEIDYSADVEGPASGPDGQVYVTTRG